MSFLWLGWARLGHQSCPVTINGLYDGAEAQEAIYA